MSAIRKYSRWQHHIPVAGLALVLPLSGLALDAVPPEALSVTVFADRYVAAGKPFTDVAVLEAWAKPARSPVLWLDSCGPGSTGQLLAAVERFHTIYAGIQIRTFAAGEAACAGMGEPTSQASLSEAPPYLPYYQSDRTGRSLVP